MAKIGNQANVNYSFSIPHVFHKKMPYDVSSLKKKILRKLFEVVYEDGWRLRYKHEMCERIGNRRNIVAGHIIKTKDNYRPKKIVISKAEDQRKQVRPKLRWMGRVEQLMRRIETYESKAEEKL